MSGPSRKPTPRVRIARPVRDLPSAAALYREDLVVLYFPEAAEWQAACDRMQTAGFRPVKSFNPYWDVRGRTYQDPDGYRVVIQLERPA